MLDTAKRLIEWVEKDGEQTAKGMERASTTGRQGDAEK
jgi:hypothetical protein